MDHHRLTSPSSRQPQEPLTTGGLVLGLFIGLLFIALMLAGCKTQRAAVITETLHTDTMRLTGLQRDSIFLDRYLRDSIHVYEAQRGDTLLLTTDRWHTALRTEYRDRWKHDSIYIALHDTIPVFVEVPREVKVEKKLSPWQRFRLALGDIALMLLAVYAVAGITKRHFKW